MRAIFVETSEFTLWVRRYLTDEAYAELQQGLMENPEKGTVMPGCGGLRKLRLADPGRGKGKRGGARLIYLHVPEANQFLMIDIFDKDEKADLSAAEKNLLSEYADEFKRLAKRKRGEK